ncbi:hypothetical protein QLQ12_13945 [Actinoplanes sp. NEAU-A12]|uniref:Uncharacterized protein n=1 Tax=Actinoplanes sandaracinus TaxID=3045177 RepID=A0ABT6WIY9_9ACTN|nr:hypothetical protein [Actinoplanes sandaracinus]
MTALPDWMRPPREEGWFAEDLDRLPDAPATLSSSTEHSSSRCRRSGPDTAASSPA